jgi:hypothetical protein
LPRIVPRLPLLAERGNAGLKPGDFFLRLSKFTS